MCCSPWGREESDTTEQLNRTEAQKPWDRPAEFIPSRLFQRAPQSPVCFRAQEPRWRWTWRLTALGPRSPQGRAGLTAVQPLAASPAFHAVFLPLHLPPSAPSHPHSLGDFSESLCAWWYSSSESLHR